MHFANLSEISLTTAIEYGGKSTGLVRLRESGAPISAGIAISDQVFRSSLASINLNARIRAVAKLFSEGETEECNREILKLRGDLLSCLVDSIIPEDILSACFELGDSLAVRSSASVEDGLQSWAGIFDSFLEITKATIIRALRECWLSLFSLRSFAYAHYNHIDLATVTLSVLVQRMIPCQISGVLFSCDPLGTSSGGSLLEVQSGGGGDLVRGDISPTIYRRAQGSELTRSTGNIVLPPTILDSLLNWGSFLQEKLGYPCDIEWGLNSEGSLIFFQCRPLRVSPRENQIGNSPIPALESRFVSHVKRRMSVCHCFLMSEGHFHFSKALGLRSKLRFLTLTHDGIQSQAFIEESSLSAYQDELKELVSKDQLITHERARNIWSTSLLFMRAARALSRAKSAAALEHYFSTYRQFAATLSFTIIAGEVVREELVTASHLSAEEISVLSAPDTVSPFTHAHIELLRIASQFKAQGEITSIRHQRIAYWLRRFRHIPVNFCEAPWSEKDASDKLNEILLLSPEQLLEQQYEKTRLNRALRDKLENRIHSSVQIRLIRTLRQLTSLNEYRKSIFCKASLAFAEFLQRLFSQHDRAILNQCFLLTPREIIEYVNRRMLPDITEGRPELRGFLMENHGTIRELSSSECREFQAKQEVRDTSTLSTFAPTAIWGNSGSSGCVDGVARVVRGPQDFPHFKQGEVLVASMTSVDFVPIMNKAAAFVTDEGGLTSHAAVIARELGKPCVVGTHCATRVIPDGRPLRVDGSNGVVLLR